MPVAKPDLPLQLSATAIAEIRRLCQQWGYDTTQIRVGLSTGGCQQHLYTLGFQVSDILDEDWVYLYESDLQLAIAPDAWSALEGGTLDYAEDLMGGNFRFQHAPVTGLCSCGLSFEQVVTAA